GADPANAGHPAGRGVFVGRERELHALRASLVAAQEGHGTLVLLSGEPGIGKTRLLDETARYAGLHGAEVLWGRCYEGPGAPAFWPWIQAVRALLGDRDVSALRDLLGARAADVAALAPELRERLPDLPPTPAAAAEQTRFRLFDGLTTTLRTAAATRPLVIL